MFSEVTTPSNATSKLVVARRGRQQNIFYDNATNFTKAENVLKTLLRHLKYQQHQQRMTSSCAETGIQFKFIPARTATFGGLWEAGVNSL